MELNFTVAFLLIWKIWEGQFAGKVGGWGILGNGRGDPSNDGDDFEMGGVGWHPFMDYAKMLQWS